MVQPGMNMPIAASPITKAVIQPRTIKVRLAVNAPITDLRDASSTITTTSGTATTPLMTALQNSALIGLIGEKSSATPRQRVRVNGY